MKIIVKQYSIDIYYSLSNDFSSVRGYTSSWFQISIWLHILALACHRGVLHSSHAQSLLQMVKSSFCLRILFRKRIIQYNFVPLYESLTILLSVLKLFVPIPLNPLEKCRQCQLLCLSKFSFFFLYNGLHFSFEFISFKFFQEISFHFNPLSLIVSL